MKWWLCIVGAVALCSMAGAGEATNAAPGRYQVMSVSVTLKTSDPVRTELKTLLLKVDTATGQVWKYDHVFLRSDVNGQPAAFPVDGWTPIPADLLAEVLSRK